MKEPLLGDELDNSDRRNRRALAAVGAVVVVSYFLYAVRSFDIALPARIGLGILAMLAALSVAITVGGWQPMRWRGMRANRAWLLPRLVLIAFAMATMVTAITRRHVVAECPNTVDRPKAGAVLYAEIRDDVLVCVFDDHSGSL